MVVASSRRRCRRIVIDAITFARLLRMVAYIEVAYSIFNYFHRSCCSRRRINIVPEASAQGVGYRLGGARDRAAVLNRPSFRSVSSQTLVSITEFVASVVEEDELGWTPAREAEARWEGHQDRFDLGECD